MLVLAALVLITAVVIGLMARALSERKSATSYGAVANTRQLTDAVVNLVQAQINEATTQGATTAWASQPGAVRVFDTSGALQNIYKLYSAASLTTTDASKLGTDDMPPSTWATAPALWVDLNASAAYTDGSGVSRLAFPVLDPRDPAWTQAIPTLSTVDGLTIKTASVPGAQTDPSKAKYQPAPMPVKWLYMLRDGILIAPDSSSGTTATFLSSPDKPSAANPIVGRVAFWTDDDTCKVNVNTASDGTFWDTPRFSRWDGANANKNPDERNRGRFQPANGEYQRYPGHPATTTLTNIIAKMGASPMGTNIFNLTPRYSYGGSKGGTVVAPTNIPVKSDRLYSSTGEMLYDSSRNAFGLTRQQLDSSRFFLTARSRAPEVNLFGKPRIAIWPVHTDPTRQTPVDKLIAFCSSIRGLPYYFSRQDPASATIDIGLARNAMLLNYLDSLTSAAIPGFGGNFAAKFGTDQKQILTEIFDYIRIVNLQDQAFIVAKDSPLNKCYSVKNSVSGGLGVVTPSRKTDAGWNTRGFGRFPVISEISLLFIGMGKGKTGGSGNIDLNRSQFETTYRAFNGSLPPSTTPTLTIADDNTLVQGFLLFNFFNPAYGYSGMDLGLTIRVTGLDGLALNGKPLKMPASADLVIVNRNQGGFRDGRGYAATWDPRAMFVEWNNGDSLRLLGQSPARSRFPFYSDFVEVSNTTSTMTLTGTGSLTISIYPGTSVDPTKLIQQYTINLPNAALSASLPVPNAVASTPRDFGTGSYDMGMERTSAYYHPDYNKNGQTVSTANDAMVSLVPTGIWTDYRLLALADSIPAAAFVPHPDTAPGVRLAYGWKDGISRTVWPGARTGRILQGEVQPYDWWDGVVPATVDGVKFTGGTVGDWDNAMVGEMPGPYINKADEGTLEGLPGGIPYFESNQNWKSTDPTYFSPNRQVASAVTFGSLSTGGKRGLPWQTLLFRPGPDSHPGSISPRDHLLLDLFWMPVVEPYAISEPFSTAGKINMNYQIAPFGCGASGYLTRSTGIRSVLAGEQVAVVPTMLASSNARFPLNLNEDNGTLRQFKEKFAGNEIFKSATEICDIFLVPTGKTWTTDSAARSAWYGNEFKYVGDNIRERPYSSIYPRLTTKSNVYTVHYTVQALKIPTAENQTQWNELKGVVTGEYRGSTTLERYIDPNETVHPVPDYANPSTPSTEPTLDSYYRWRIIENAQFAF